MLTCPHFLFTIVLQVTFLRGLMMGRNRPKVVYGSPGGVVLMPGLEGERLDMPTVIEWKHFLENQPDRSVVDYFFILHRTDTFNLYRDRIHFYPSNASFLLQNLTWADQGIYKMIVDLDESNADSVLLVLIDVVSQPRVMTNSSCAQSTIKLQCFACGKLVSFTWARDGGSVPKDLWLSTDNTSLVIDRATGADSATYTCSVQNPVSQKETPFKLVIDDRCNFQTGRAGGVIVTIVLIPLIVIPWGLTVYYWRKAKEKIRSCGPRYLCTSSV
ncbi:hepatic and glial cell adhesion molecule-like isoform X2 [Heptranchias perlo]|uniref:hepatic and glial cell adhesion molecule-like isoform X2 n=1 Tax=Heptranchias perlo TaxID=212740 RepID=UPI0035595E76